MHADAHISRDGKYRFCLSRRWGFGPLAHWCMLNPSTADHRKDDPTIRRVMAFSRAWGFDGCFVTNVFPLRATNPRVLLTHAEPDSVITQNEETIETAAFTAGKFGMMVCAWGAAVSHPVLLDASLSALELIRKQTRSMCLGVTRDGHPRHPLYVRGDTKLELL